MLKSKTFIMSHDDTGRVIFEKNQRPIPDPVGKFRRYHVEIGGPSGTDILAITTFASGQSGIRHENHGKVILINGTMFRIGSSMASMNSTDADVRAFLEVMMGSLQMA